jgi:DNA-binding transcriptional ArsR family regulator
MVFQFLVDRIEPMRVLSFRWHPYAVDPSVDYSKELPTLVVFELEEVTGGTMLTVTESGFDKISLERRAKAFAANEKGWSEQVKLIDKYLACTPKAEACHERLSPTPRNAPTFRSSSPPSVTRHVYISSLDCAEGPLSITRLTAGAAVSRQAITKHVHALEEAGLAHVARVGRESVWQLRPNRLADVQRCLDQISRQWGAALGRLRIVVEK